jgi:DNA-binding transcriptional MerR regulator
MKRGDRPPEKSALRGEERRYRVNRLAALCSVTPHTIRFYAQIGLLVPERIGRTRFFSPADRGRLEYIQRCRRLGLKLAVIKEMLDRQLVGKDHVTEMRIALAKHRRRLAALGRQRQDIAHEMDEVQAQERALVAQLRELGVNVQDSDPIADPEQPLDPATPDASRAVLPLMPEMPPPPAPPPPDPAPKRKPRKPEIVTFNIVRTEQVRSYESPGRFTFHADPEPPVKRGRPKKSRPMPDEDEEPPMPDEAEEEE